MLSDPRVFFAAERTLLAWLRTGLTIMAFGFVVARFGPFLRLLAAQQPGVVVNHLDAHHDVSNVPSILLVLVGIACMVLGPPAWPLRRNASSRRRAEIAQRDLSDRARADAGGARGRARGVPRGVTHDHA